MDRGGPQTGTTGRDYRFCTIGLHDVSIEKLATLAGRFRNRNDLEEKGKGRLKLISVKENR